MTLLKTADLQLSFQSTRLEPFIQAIFRLLDQNGDGHIEPSEITSFLVDVVGCLSNLVMSIHIAYPRFFVN